ncbi:P-loop containing nucleoside triphosphate hydrolase protein [Multifurca ochricompacta]|uniref:P-loop containing nucleoside triphosphate hydrolase protein n=1 Tax=Multifurca ochricompacta TaxID=376703 RepID=A0AAD4MDQ4_9AGAM|nr:P-loop containing nucleoside triphosphate hydrolase protein [Multifurca ochricompacta]
MWPSSSRRLVGQIQLCFQSFQVSHRRLLATQPQFHQPSPLTLRPYQEICLKACLDAHNSGASRIGVSLPTGAGKTAVFISLLSRLEPRRDRPNATRSLVIVNSIELAKQAAAQAQRQRPDWIVEIEQGRKHKASGDANLTVATYQTLLEAGRLHKFSPQGFKAIVVDEAHHAAAPSYRRILSFFHPEIQCPENHTHACPARDVVPIFGFSATFSRHDGLALGSVFERIVYHRDFLDMIREQWLCNVRFTTVKANINLKDVTISTHSGDFSATSLAHVINTETLNRLVIQTWLDKAAKERKSTIVFAVNVAHARALTKTFQSAGVDARYLYSGTPNAERSALIEHFRVGDFPVLLNCALLTEGTDIPNIDCVIIARPTKSRNLFLQMIGRGMRLSPDTGKQDCHVIDFVDSVDRLVGIVSAPTLFGLDPAAVENVVDTQEREPDPTNGDSRAAHPIGDNRLSVPDPKSVTYIDYDNPFTLVNQSQGILPHIARLSRNAWVDCGDGICVLECLGKGHIRIEPIPGTENHFHAHYAPAIHPETASALNISRFQTNRKILDASDLAGAVRGCDTYVAEKVLKGPLSLALWRTAKWREGPASPAQKLLVAKKWGYVYKSVRDFRELPDDVTFPERLRTLTKGEAAHIITRLKHGALRRYTKKLMIHRKLEAAIAKEKQRQAKEHVRVGPLAPIIPQSTVTVDVVST